MQAASNLIMHIVANRPAIGQHAKHIYFLLLSLHFHEGEWMRTGVVDCGL